jgi:hypothetical protein
VYRDHERYETTYFAPFPGTYFTGDGARRDSDGYYWITGAWRGVEHGLQGLLCLWRGGGFESVGTLAPQLLEEASMQWVQQGLTEAVFLHCRLGLFCHLFMMVPFFILPLPLSRLTGRVDDVINVSGHRIGTAEVESALVAHPQCAEAAVVGYEHPVKGQGIWAYVTLMEVREVAVPGLLPGRLLVCVRGGLTGLGCTRQLSLSLRGQSECAGRLGPWLLTLAVLNVLPLVTLAPEPVVGVGCCAGCGF